jgi:23S rRNA (adenine2503-C2)-methyltransferase
VFIPDEDRGTLCISSQVGCTLTCRFCHTGTQKLVRNLTAEEIVSQVLVARDDLKEWPRAGRNSDERLITNIVMMGMGEPLYNFENVRDAINVIADGEGLSVSKRRITLSTAGVVPMIPRAGEEIGSMLAISLHAPRDDVRDVIVPLNKKYPIKELIAACKAYPGLSNARRITFEYVMLKGVNDSNADARELVKVIRGIPAKINQPVAGRALRMLRLGANRRVWRDRQSCGLCLTDPNTAWPRHHGGVRAIEERKRQKKRERADGRATL